MNVIIFALCAVGIYLLTTATYPGIYAPAAAALRKRAPKPLSQMEVMVRTIASRLEPHMDIDPIQRVRLAETLKSLGHTETPEGFRAQALARALLLSCALFWLIFLSPLFGFAVMLLLGVSLYSGAQKKLQGEMDERRQRIERELPQFASTIRQSLNSTGDVITILESYRKICGPALAGEIDRTLNDMVTGNPSRAISALESRIASAKLGQLTRGLLAVLRGDDQKIYFDMLANEYRKGQNEEVAKALLTRPKKLLPYMGLLFVCLILMICAAMGADLAQQMGTLF